MSRLTVLAGLLAAAPVFAQVAVPNTPPPPKPTLAQVGLMVYPAKGQTAEQQKKDEAACYEWAETNTGLTLAVGSVDTEAAAKNAAGQAGHGAVVKGAAAGTAGGLVIGAIAGDAGKGAAIGAVAGSMGGLRGRSRAKKQAAQAGAGQAAEANQQAIDQFKKAAAVCLEGRGYTAR